MQGQRSAALSSLTNGCGPMMFPLERVRLETTSWVIWRTAEMEVVVGGVVEKEKTEKRREFEEGSGAFLVPIL